MPPTPLTIDARRESKRIKRKLDAERIERYMSEKYPHLYDYVEFRPWTGSGYIKSWYDLRLEDGTIIEHVWPNAGQIRVGKVIYTGESNVQIRLSDDDPY